MRYGPVRSNILVGFLLYHACTGKIYHFPFLAMKQLLLS